EVGGDALAGWRDGGGEAGAEAKRASAGVRDEGGPMPAGAVLADDDLRAIRGDVDGVRGIRERWVASADDHARRALVERDERVAAGDVVNSHTTRRRGWERGLVAVEREALEGGRPVLPRTGEHERVAARLPGEPGDADPAARQRALG